MEKKGIMEGIINLVDSKITNAILRTSDGTDFKSIDDYQLFKLISCRSTTHHATCSLRIWAAIQIAKYLAVIGSVGDRTRTMMANGLQLSIRRAVK